MSFASFIRQVLSQLVRQQTTWMEEHFRVFATVIHFHPSRIFFEQGYERGATTLSITTLSIKSIFETFSIMTLSITAQVHYAEFHYAECGNLFIVMLSVEIYLLLCWMSLCWVSLCWVSLCWVSLCWVSLLWVSLCSMSRSQECNFFSWVLPINITLRWKWMAVANTLILILRYNKKYCRKKFYSTSPWDCIKYECFFIF